MNAKFVPSPVEKTAKRNIKIEVPPDTYEQMKSLAAGHNLSLKEFVRQAVFFAIDNMPTTPKRR